MRKMKTSNFAKWCRDITRQDNMYISEIAKRHKSGLYCWGWVYLSSCWKQPHHNLPLPMLTKMVFSRVERSPCMTSPILISFARSARNLLSQKIPFHIRVHCQLWQHCINRKKISTTGIFNSLCNIRLAKSFTEQHLGNSDSLHPVYWSSDNPSLLLR